MVDAAALAQEAVTRWSPLAEEEEVTLSYRGPDRAEARASAGALPQILDNLIDNAITASPPDSKVEVCVEPASDAPGTDGALIVRVTDQGPGLSDAHLERATDRFWRAPDAPPGGTGLGLAIASELTTLSGGGLRLERSDPAPGLVAVVELPGPS